MATGEKHLQNVDYPKARTSGAAVLARNDYAPSTITDLDTAVIRSSEALLSRQAREGHWVFDLEADTTIPSEYVFFKRFLNRPVEEERAGRIAAYLRKRQLPSGGWPLFEEGRPDISATVKSYFALKLLGDSPEEPHMANARKLVLSLGGAARVNVFTRITLAIFGQVPWRTAPAMPVEIMHLPRWFFFHLDKVSYWSRTVIVPLLILYAKRPVVHLGPHEGIRELFTSPPEGLRNLDTFIKGNPRKNLFIVGDRLLKNVEPFMPVSIRNSAIGKAERFTRERMAGEGGIGAIFPAMVNAVMALKVLGYQDDDPDLKRGLKAVEDLIVEKPDECVCQPCVSPVWDTCLSLSALLEAGLPMGDESVERSVEWLFSKQILNKGDWSNRAPGLEPGGWAFQFENDFYPDLDDTSMVLMAILRAGVAGKGGGALKKRARWDRVGKAVNWIVGMQSSDGGWGAFDIDNNYLYLNDIPFADHGALLDPSTSDLTGRCVELLCMLGYGRDFPAVKRGIEFLKKEQDHCGAWFGRWGVNYIYGTWSVLSGLRLAGEDMSQPYIRRAVDWLKSCQNPDGGWGETCDSYEDPKLAGKGISTASQTSWALLALMAAGEVKSPAVRKGVKYLSTRLNDDGGWDEKHFTGTGFPRVFYLKYHGYSQYFPLWALGVYRRLSSGQPTHQDKVRLWRPPDLDLPVVGRKK